MFYDLFCQLCHDKGVSVTRATVDMGLSRTIGSKWKRTGATPNGETLNRIAEYFGVTADYLLSGNEAEKHHATQSAIDAVDDELREYLDELRSRPEQRLLFSVTKNATRSQIEAIVRMIEEMQGNT